MRQSGATEPNHVAFPKDAICSGTFENIFLMSPVWVLQAEDLDVQMKALNIDRIISESYA